LITEFSTMPGIKTILHPTDFSEHARYAFQMACAMARENRATLVVLHVMMPSVSPLQQQPPPDPLQPAESQGAAAQFPWPEPSDPQIRVEHRLAEGDPAEEILHLAGRLRCDLIVMGTHGRTGLGRLLTGSVAEVVLRKAVSPVLVVKIPPGTAPEVETETTANSGDVVDARLPAAALTSARTRTLVHTAAVEVVRLIVRAGQEITGLKSKGETVVHCLEGRVAFTALGKTQTLEAGDLLHLPAAEPHAFTGIEDASVLLTIVTHA
jgi:nucleotide-binding universal stress UspA family protein/mannose-6-phosphate isomerase-like protein (cupin superfamily)